MTPRRSGRRAVMRLRLALGGALVALAVAAALLGFAWTPGLVKGVDVAAALKGPGAGAWLGTDPVGRDVASMLMVGARYSLGVAAAAVAVGLLAGVPLGLWAAAEPAARGPVGGFVALVFAFPAVVTATLAAAVMGPGALTAVLAIGLFDAAVFARIVAAAARGVWRRPFVGAAMALGRTRWTASWRHVLPNLSGLIVVQATTLLAIGVLAEAGLSYLGFGVRPPAASWGRMLHEAQSFLFVEPRLALWPGLAIALTTLGFNLLGDGLRDRMEPEGR